MDPASTSFVLGYHGCDKTVAEGVLSGRQALRLSHNDYDWLGDGIYFWEHNAARAYEFACEVRERQWPGPRIHHPAVVGAVIDLGLCLNLLERTAIALVRQAYEDLAREAQAAHTRLPRNSLGADRLLRRLDCAVIRLLHDTHEAAGRASFDTVRAAFIEGERLYPEAGFAAKNHIQVCVRNVACIKGYFRPLDGKGRPLVFGG